MTTNGIPVEELLRFIDGSDIKKIYSYFIIVLEEIHPSASLILVQNHLLIFLRHWYFYCPKFLIL